MDLLSPDDISALFGSPFFSAFWPSLLGGLFVFIAVLKGSRITMLILVMLTGLAQAWHLGVFGSAS